MFATGWLPVGVGLFVSERQRLWDAGCDSERVVVHGDEVQVGDFTQRCEACNHSSLTIRIVTSIRGFGA